MSIGGKRKGSKKDLYKWYEWLKLGEGLRLRCN